MLLCNSLLKGTYKITKGRGNKASSSIEVPNIITNYGLNAIGQGRADLRYFCLGRGNTPSKPEMTSLENYITGSQEASSERIYSNISIKPYWVRREFYYRFPEGSLEGDFSEIGIGGQDAAQNGSNVFSRALIRDLNGNPTTITVLPDEWLDVHYFLTYYLPSEDVVGSFVLNGKTHFYTVRPAELDSQGTRWTPSNRPNSAVNRAFIYEGDIRTERESPLPPSEEVHVSNDTYVQDSFAKTATIKVFPGKGNFDNGIKGILFRTGMSSAYQIGFDPPIKKTDIQTITFKVKHSWGRDQS